MSFLTLDRLECLPLIHGRLAFALEARRRLLEHRYEAVAVELPPSLGSEIDGALDRLPRVSLVVYTDEPSFVAPSSAPRYYVPIQPADGIVEALRIARGERIPTHFVDSEIHDFHSRPVMLPEPHALHTLGLEDYYLACAPALALHPPSQQDLQRESHMAWCLRRLLKGTSGRVLFLCGLAHWARIRALLETDKGERSGEEGIPPEQISLMEVDPRSLPVIMGEMPFLVAEFEAHRQGFELDDFDAVEAVKRLVLRARDHFEKENPGSLEKPRPQSLRTLLDFVRKLTVRKGALIPDTYTLAVAAKGVVGNDFALTLLDLAHRYPPQELPLAAGSSHESGALGEGDDGEGDGREPWREAAPEEPVDSEGDSEEDSAPMISRVPGSLMSFGRLKLERRPDIRRRTEWKKSWTNQAQCSWPPEDIVIENFRDYVGKRALSLARVGQSRTEPFTGSFLDGIDLRETLRDVVERRIHVREEPRVPGAVGALVIIFEEDDFGVRYPWRATWMAEHQNESTLAFYATDYMENIIGPGIARAHYGGCLLIFPPRGIPDIWDDLRFERAKTPSERLLLAAIYWSEDHYVVHMAARPASEGVRAEAVSRGKHILHLPLSTFSSTTLERIRHVHVLNDHRVRTYAHKFIR